MQVISLGGSHQNLVDPAAIHVDHFEAPALIVEMLALVRQLFQHGQGIARRGGEIAVFRQGDFQPVGQGIGPRRRRTAHRAESRRPSENCAA